MDTVTESHNWTQRSGYYGAPIGSKAHESMALRTITEEGQKDCNSQNTRMFAVWLCKQHTDNSNIDKWKCQCVTGRISQGPIPSQRAAGSQSQLREWELTSPGYELPDGNPTQSCKPWKHLYINEKNVSAGYVCVLMCEGKRGFKFEKEV